MRMVVCLGALAVVVSGCSLTDSGFAGVTGDEVNVAMINETNGHYDAPTGTFAFVTGEGI